MRHHLVEIDHTVAAVVERRDQREHFVLIQVELRPANRKKKKRFGPISSQPPFLLPSSQAALNALVP